jgi:hypothetical protein
MSLVGFPLLLIPLAIYNIFVFLMPSVAFTSPIISVTLLSRAQWTPTFGDALLALAMVLLWFEIVKASRPGARFLTDHLLSLIVFGGATAEFLLLGKFGNSTFFLLTVLTSVEFLAGASIGIRHRRFARYEAADASARHEPTMEPEDHSQVEEPSPSLESLPAKQQPSAPMRSEPKPPEMMTMTPAHETSKETPKPVPTLAVNHAPDARPVGAPKVTGWTVADLMRDDKPTPGQTPKP